MSIYNFNSIFHQVDLSLLRHFFAVSTFGGFSKASRATGVSQPALSLGMKKLEKSLGVTLIDRSDREFRLTPAGKTLMTFCQRFQGSFEAVMSSIGAPDVAPRKRLRIGTALSVGFGPLDALCARVQEEDESFELELLEQNTYQLLEDVNAGKLDAALVPNDVFDNRLRFVPLVRDPVIFVVGEKLSGLFSRYEWKKAIARTPLITFPRETPMRTLTDKICVTGHAEFKAIYSVNSIESLKLLVEKGRGGAFVLKTLVASELAEGGLLEVRLPIKLPSSGISLVLPMGEGRTGLAREIERLLKL